MIMKNEALAHVSARMPINVYVLSTLLVAYAWETLEHYLEADSWPVVMYWMQGVEFWGNRMMADPAAVLLGALVYWRWGTPTNAWVTRAFIVSWLFVNIFILSDCMAIQREFATFGTLFGDKRVAWTDVWTIEHFASGLSIGGFLLALRRRRRRPD